MSENDSQSMPALDETLPAAESASPDVARPASDRTSPTPARSGGGAIAWLSLLLVLALAAAGAWALLEAQQRESELRERLQGIEVGSGRDLSTIEQINRNLERRLELELAAVKTALRGEWLEQLAPLRDRVREIAAVAEDTKRLQLDLDRQVASLQDELTSVRQTLNAGLARIESQLTRQRARMDRFSVADRDSWLLAEAQYLLRLANQRLIITGDTSAALALMRSVDGILHELDDADLLEVRRALAADIAAVDAVPRPDLEGIYLRLNALIEKASALIIFELPESDAAADGVEAEGLEDRLRLGYEKALGKLADYVVFRRRDVPVETLMDPQQEGMVRQTIRMLLEQAQIAMLSGNQRVFRDSLERARGWISQFLASDERAAGAVLRELDDLAAIRVSVDMPDATQTLQTLRAAMAARGREDGSAR